MIIFIEKKNTFENVIWKITAFSFSMNVLKKKRNILFGDFEFGRPSTNLKSGIKMYDDTHHWFDWNNI